jgi:hypothetical protein
MALTAKQRKAIPASKFVYPASSSVAKSTSTGGPKTGLYPIDTKQRAYAALSYSAQKGTAGSYATVEAAVNKRYPDIETKHHKPKGKR